MDYGVTLSLLASLPQLSATNLVTPYPMELACITVASTPSTITARVTFRDCYNISWPNRPLQDLYQTRITQNYGLRRYCWTLNRTGGELEQMERIPAMLLEYLLGYFH